ncbi:MAG: hypothetical protein ACYCQL_00045 [Acidithiobacillus sp.]
MAHSFGYGSGTEEDEDQSPEEVIFDDFWFEVRQSVAGRPGFDMSGYPVEEGSLLREPGEPQLRLAVDNAHKFPVTSPGKRILR